jgi:hypothetical protein
MLVADVDGDACGDIIATALPKVFWLEATDIRAGTWKARQIGVLRKTDHVNGQGYMLGQIVPGGRPEVLLACGDGVYYFEIPERPEGGDYGNSRSAAGDIIKGGRPEIVLNSGDTVGPLNLYRFEGGAWHKNTLIEVVDHGHSLQVADIDADGNLDIFAAEMTHWHDGENPDAKLWILYGDGKGGFRITELEAAEGLGNHESKLGDLDGDGDLDILQKPFEIEDPKENIDIWLNNGTAAN